MLAQDGSQSFPIKGSLDAARYSDNDRSMVRPGMKTICGG